MKDGRRYATLTPIRKKLGRYINNRQRNFRADAARHEECFTTTKESIGPSAGGNSAVVRC